MEGEGVESTGVKKNDDGSYTVVSAKNDGDNGIYLADENGNYDIKKSKSIGYNTLNPFDFLIPNDKTGGFKGVAKVSFKIDELENGKTIFNNYTSTWEGVVKIQKMALSTILMPALAYASRNNGYYDIKTKYPESTGGFYTPVSMGNNTITTVRSLGNLIFGANMRTTYEHTFDTCLDTPTSFYKLNMPIVGWYNQHQNDGYGYNSGFPYYGEHTYSGINIYRGYFNAKRY